MLEQGQISRQTIWDTLVFSKVQAQFGGRLRVVIAGKDYIVCSVYVFEIEASQVGLIENRRLL